VTLISCENCSYNCSLCRQPITNEAILTGDESYCPSCFRCRSCENKIEELVFAKTSQGIYWWASLEIISRRCECVGQHDLPQRARQPKSKACGSETEQGQGQQDGRFGRCLRKTTICS
jgi:hypothetical protein